MLLYVQISLQQYHCLLMVNVFPLISAIVLGDFLFYVTAVNKMFNLGAGGDVLCYRVARNGGDDEFPHRLVLGRSYQCWGEQLGLESNHCLSPLMNLTWLHLFFNCGNDYFPSNTERGNSVLSICCIAGVKGPP